MIEKNCSAQNVTDVSSFCSVSATGPDAGRAKHPAKPGPGKTEFAQVGEVEQKKKVMQHLVYFVSSLL